LIDKFIDADGKYHFKDTGICIYEWLAYLT
jgi:hypothetical protein